ncbi:MAG: Ig-like domain-containing protein, partial [Candidatus Krumholzibacteria bacterium]|nr:Ig-like domain-containing protein [Candidatus Krumholzibacteria bacterium]
TAILVQGNFIGIDATGTTALGNGASGVVITSGASNNTIGGTVEGARNIISGNPFQGVQVDGSNNIVQGNYIGTDATGMAAIGNGQVGVWMRAGASDNLIGGTTAGARNVISANGEDGVNFGDVELGTENNIVQGNYIGTDATGTGPLGNVERGVRFSHNSGNNTLGGTTLGSGNVVAFNNSHGVTLRSNASTGNTILGNSIFSNARLGIDIGENGVTANDSADVDVGANDRQNYPVLASAVRTDTDITIDGSLNSYASATFRIEFFSTAQGDTSGHGEGETYLGFTDVTTDVMGDANFSDTFPVAVAPGASITATATDSVGSTSEFSLNILVNTAPGVVAAIADTTVAEDSSPIDNYRDLTEVFADTEEGHALSFIIQDNSNPGLVSAIIDADSALDLSFTPDSAGSATIVIRGTDSESLFVDDTFVVTVSPINDSPTVLSAMPDTSVVEDSAPVNDYRDLNEVFGDTEDGGALTFTVQDNSNPALVTAVIDGADSTLGFTVAPDSSGSATLVIRATDSGSLFTEDTLVITVTPVNDAPTVAIAMPDTTADEDSPPIDNYRDLNDVFQDTEDGGNLTFAIQDNSDPSIVTAIIDADSALDLSFPPDATGSATLVIRATDSEALFVEDTLVVTVTFINDPPIVTSAIPDTTVEEDSSPIEDYRDLNDVFADPEDGSVLAFTIHSNSDPALVTAVIDADSALDLSFAPDGTGSATIVIRATDSGALFAEDTLIVSVTPVNDAPTVAAAMPDTTLDEDSPPLDNYRDLNDVFADIEDGGSLTFTIQDNTNPSLVSATIDADSALDLTFAPDSSGSATIVIRAADPEALFVEDTVLVTVTPVNDTPTLSVAIPDTTVSEDSPPIDNYRDLNDVFSDVEDGSGLIFAVEDNSAPSLVTVTIDADSALDLSFAANSTGSATIVIRATDAGALSVDDTLVVTVSEVNDPPTVVSAMPDTTVEESSPALANYRDLNDVFTDHEDGSALTFAVQGNSNPILVTATIDADSALDLSIAQNQAGNATIVIRASDSGTLFVEDTLVVTVTPDSHTVTVITAPAGLKFSIDTVEYTAPQPFTLEERSTHDIGVDSPQQSGDTLFLFSDWSDGGTISHEITVPDTDTTFAANFDTRFTFAVIDSITDVPNDQGGWARLHFTRSGFDHADEDSLPITVYDIHRRVDDLALVGSVTKFGERITEEEPVSELAKTSAHEGSGVTERRNLYRFEGRTFVVMEEAGAPTAAWEIIGNVTARQQDQYIRLVPTVGDSSETIPYSVYFIAAHTTTPSVFFDSAPDSGFSIDNLAPAAPQGFDVAYNKPAGNELSWQPSTDGDFQYFRIYRSTEQDFTPSPSNLVRTTVDTQWLDTVSDGWQQNYKMTAVDHVGNESPPSTPGTVTAITAPTMPTHFALHQNAPNPFNPTTVIRYDVPASGGRVTLRVYDVGGRLIRTLVDAVQTPGEKTAVFEGKDDRGNPVASGVYFYRLQSAGYEKTRKMVLLQ